MVAPLRSASLIRMPPMLVLLVLLLFVTVGVCVENDTSSSSSSSLSGISAALSSMPPCMGTCMGKAFAKTNCAPTDEACICRDDSFMQNMFMCVESSCSWRQTLAAYKSNTLSCPGPFRTIGARDTIVSTVLPVLSGLLVLQRLGLKWWTRIGLGLDDLLIVLSAAAGVPLSCVVVYGMVPSGMGRDIWTLHAPQITAFIKFYFIFLAVYMLEIALIKLALLFFYLRIFPSTGVRRLLWGTVAFVCGFGIAFPIAMVFTCRPVSFYWEGWMEIDKKVHCSNSWSFLWANAVINIVLDLWIFAIPVTQIQRLQLSTKKKLQVSTMFLTGLVVTGLSILRIHYFVAFGYTPINPTRQYADLCMWSVIEVQLGIICNCMPTFRRFLLCFLPGFSDSTPKYSTGVGDTGASTSKMRRGMGSSGYRRTTEDGTVVSNHEVSGARRGVLRIGQPPPWEDELELVQTRTGQETRAGSDGARPSGSAGEPL